MSEDMFKSICKEEVKVLALDYLVEKKEQREHKIEAKYAYLGMAD